MARQTRMVVVCVVVPLALLLALLLAGTRYVYHRVTYDSAELPQIDVPGHPLPADNGWPALAAAASRLRSHSDAIYEAYRAEWDAEAPVLTACEPDLADAHAALRKECVHDPPSDWRATYPYLKDLRDLARAFAVEGRALERSDRHAEAGRVHADTLKLGPAAATNGAVIHWLSATSATDTATPELARCIGSGGLSEADLEWLVDQLDRAHATFVPLDEALAVEWALTDAYFADLTNAPGLGGLVVAWTYSPARKAFRVEMGRVLAALRAPNRTEPVELQSTGNARADSNLPTMGGAARRMEQRRAQFAGLRIHAAAQLHRLRTSRWPEDLDDLGITHGDPFSDVPMTYERRGDDYVIYSVGPNGIDEGGTGRIVWKDNTGDLIIWPAGPVTEPSDRAASTHPGGSMGSGEAE